MVDSSPGFVEVSDEGKGEWSVATEGETISFKAHEVHLLVPLPVFLMQTNSAD